MVTNLINNNGNATKNQFVIIDGTTNTFQSYATTICEVHHGSACIKIDSDAFNYSRTTSKYLLQFLNQEFNTNLKRKDVEAWMENGSTGDVKLYNTTFDVLVW